jgi:hypothetical protein
VKSKSFLSLKALIVLVSVVAAFLLPVASGPFSAVYGPATAFRAIREGLQVQSGIMLFGMMAALLAALRTFFSWPSSSVLCVEINLAKCRALRC